MVTIQTGLRLPDSNQPLSLKSTSSIIPIPLKNKMTIQQQLKVIKKHVFIQCMRFPNLSPGLNYGLNI